MKKRNAFTLAEVLITLGIIGIVAAMTLPALVQKFEKTILKNQIKKTYSMLSQLQQKLLFEWGDALLISENKGYEQFNNAMIENLKIIKKCDKNALAKNCIPRYRGLNVAGCPAFTEDAVYNRQTVYILVDGQILIPYHNDWRSLWLIDVNGRKGPNKPGYDLFQVTLDDTVNGKPGKLSFTNGCMDANNEIKGGLSNYKDIENWH